MTTDKINPKNPPSDESKLDTSTRNSRGTTNGDSSSSPPSTEKLDTSGDLLDPTKLLGNISWLSKPLDVRSGTTPGNLLDFTGKGAPRNLLASVDRTPTRPGSLPRVDITGGTKTPKTESFDPASLANELALQLPNFEGVPNKGKKGKTPTVMQLADASVADAAPDAAPATAPDTTVSKPAKPAKTDAADNVVLPPAKKAAAGGVEIPALDISGVEGVEAADFQRIQEKNGAYFEYYKDGPHKGLIKSIASKDGKVVRQFTYDEDNKVASVKLKIKDEDGDVQKTTFVRDGDTWKIEAGAGGVVDRAFDGQILLSQNGELSIQSNTKDRSIWKTIRPDGSMFNERQDASGARVALKDNKATRITREDGTTLQFADNKQDAILEFKPGQGKPVTWTEKNKVWTSDGKPPETRKDLTMHRDGSYSFADAENNKHIVRGDGSELVEKPSVTASGAKVALDSEGNVRRITRADGSVIDHYAKSDIFVEKPADGSTPIVYNKNEKGWVGNNKEAELRAAAALDKDGNTIFQGSDGLKHILRGDGRELIEAKEANAGGAIVAKEKHSGKVERIIRADGTVVDSYPNTNTIVEAPNDGRPAITLKKQGETWTTDAQPPQQARQNIEFADNGIMSFTTADGLKHHIRGEGTEVLEGPGKGKFTFDAQGRPTLIDRGKDKIEIAYLNDKTNEIKTATVTGTNEKGEPYTKVFNKVEGKDEYQIAGKADTRERYDQYRKRIKGEPVAEWTGKVQLSNDGMFSTRNTASKKEMVQDRRRYWKEVEKKPDEMWTTYRPDGSEVKEHIADNGTRAQYDDKNNLRYVRRQDGITFDTNPEMTQIIESNPKTGERITWSKQPDNSWKSDSKKFDNSVYGDNVRHNLTFNKEGYMLFSTADGNKHILKENYSRQLIKPDKSVADIDRDGIVTRVIAQNGSYRTFEHVNNQLVKATDMTKDGVKVIFDINNPTEKRQQARVTKEGDLIFLNPDGSAGIERSNFSKIKLDKEGDILTVTQQNGNTRALVYHPTLRDADGHKVVMNIEDTRVLKLEGAQGPAKTRTELWMRQMNPDGTPSKDFAKAKTDKDGRIVHDMNGKPEIAMKKSPEGKDVPITRQNVVICRDGNYEYTTKVKDANGNFVDKTHVSKSSNRDSGEGFTSESVEEAHYALLETYSALEKDQTKIAFFERCMKAVEKRMDNLIWLASHVEGQDREKLEERFQKTASDTFDHVREMLEAPNSDKQFFNKDQRTWLGLEFMQYAADPASGNQSPRGTCWINSSINMAMRQNPDDFARYLKEISLTGSFKGKAGIFDDDGRRNRGGRWQRDQRGRQHWVEDQPKTDEVAKDGHTITFPRDRFNLNRDWRSLAKARQSSMAGPIQYIFEQAITYPKRPHKSPEAGNYDESVEEVEFVTGQYYHHSSKHFHNLIDDSAVKTLLLDGGYTTSGGGHMWGNDVDVLGNDVVFFLNDQHGGESDHVKYRVSKDKFAKWLKSDGRVDFSRDGSGGLPDNPLDFIDGPPIGPGPDSPVPINPDDGRRRRRRDDDNPNPGPRPRPWRPLFPWRRR